MLRCLTATIEGQGRPDALTRAQAVPNDGVAAAVQQELVDLEEV